MPNGDAGAEDWGSGLAGRIGRAVAARRTQLLLTADGLSGRTKKLGYPIAAAAIGRIENNERSGRIDVAELLVLAAALEIPPVLLLFPGFPAGPDEVLPGVSVASDSAMRWFSGSDGFPSPVDDDSDTGLYATSGVNAGIALVELVNEQRQLGIEEFGMQIELDGEPDPHRAEELRGLVAQVRSRLEALPAAMAEGLTKLWGAGERPGGKP